MNYYNRNIKSLAVLLIVIGITIPNLLLSAPSQADDHKTTENTVFILAYIDKNASPAQKHNFQKQIDETTANITKKFRVVNTNDKLTFQYLAANGFGKLNPFPILLISSSDLEWIKMNLNFMTKDKTYIIKTLDPDEEYDTITVPLFPIQKFLQSQH